jgi:Na+-driven multidrug efflux pump
MDEEVLNVEQTETKMEDKIMEEAPNPTDIPQNSQFREFLQLFIQNLKVILYLAVPVIISYLASMTMGIVDQIFLGHIGTTEMASAALANSINICLNAIPSGLASGFLKFSLKMILQIRYHGKSSFRK